MKLSQFKFELPIELIAQQPAEYRDEARMMVLHRKSGEIEHRLVKDLIEYLNEDDVLVLNNTRVFPARMYATKEKTNAHIEVFLLRELNHKFRYWDVLVDPARKIRIGNKLYFAGDDSIVAEVIDNTTSRGRTLRFLTDYPEEEFMEHLYQLGETPLPRYISRDWSNTEEDEEKRIERDKEIAEGRAADARNYQAIDEIATEIGAVAAPASCLHFSRILLKRLEIQGVDIQMMTSHVGLGNFKPVDVEDLTKHKVDSEEYFIPEALSQSIDRAHESNHRICVVGTETMRAIESVVGTRGQVPAKHGWTNKFIFPPYDFTVADANFVNFYLPESSQLMQVAAFAGYDHMMHAYEVAVQEGYRFGDFGDAMLIID